MNTPASRYKTVSLLGNGGFAEVYRVIASEQQFAQKRLASTEWDDVQRFKREVKLLQSLDHVNVVKVLDAQLDTSPYWFVMPLYPRNLKQELILRRSKDLNYAWIRATFLQILDGVEYLHQNNIIHRDLKPENVLLSDSDLVVADLGLGRNLDSNSVQLTRSKHTLGTPDYAAPEQFDNSKKYRSSPTLDVYSVGKILYDLLVDRANLQPFEGSRLPAPFRSMYKRATEWSPEMRYQTVAEMRRDFEETVGYFSGDNEVVDVNAVIAAYHMAVQEPQAYPRIVANLILALEDLWDDPRSIFDALMAVPVELFVALEESDITTARRLILRFSEHAQNPPQWWEFEFTDSIGGKARELFLGSSDEEIRSTLAETNLVVGTGYSRYSVMKMLGDMLCKVSKPDEIVYLCQRLGAYSVDKRRQASNAFRDNVKLPPALSQLFPKS